MYSATKKTRNINSFKRTATLSGRDLAARYGQRINTKAIHSTSAGSIGTVIPEGSSVIGSMIAGQNALASHKESLKETDDLPP